MKNLSILEEKKNSQNFPLQKRVRVYKMEGEERKDFNTSIE